MGGNRYQWHDPHPYGAQEPSVAVLERIILNLIHDVLLNYVAKFRKQFGQNKVFKHGTLSDFQGKLGAHDLNRILHVSPLYGHKQFGVLPPGDLNQIIFLTRNNSPG